MRESGRMINEARNKRARKPKVAPKIGSTVKLEKILARSMKSLSIGNKRKINMEDSSSDSDEAEDDGAMNVDQIVPKITEKKIKKKSGSMAQQKMMKKEIRRLNKMGHKKEARKMTKKRLAGVDEATHGGSAPLRSGI